MSKRSMLILAKAKDEYLNKEIKLVKTIEEAEHLYGTNSQLTEAYKEAKAVGTHDIYTCNIFKYTDYVAILKSITNYNFTYIVPSFDLLDKFKSLNGKTYFLAELYSNVLLEQVTGIILTGKHADEYEDIQHFVDTLNSDIGTFKKNTYEKLIFGTNLSFVANNLKNKKFANVILASMLLQSSKKEYPILKEKAIFDLRSADFEYNECVFFNNCFSSTDYAVPANLINFSTEDNYYKSILNYEVVKELLERLDMSEFKGRAYSNHTKVMIENKIKSIISESVGELIEDGLLLSVDVNVTGEREIELSSKIRIKPYHFLQYIDISGEI